MSDTIKEELMNEEIIEEIAGDLYRDCRIGEYDADRDPVWISKYVEIDYSPAIQ